MERMELVEKLRERANVSYEEANEILTQTGDDLLEAIVILEKQGKINRQAAKKAETENPMKSETAETEASEPARKTATETAVQEKENTCGPFRSIMNFLLHTSFRISRKEVFAMPTWLFALLLPATWEFVIPVMVIALFFGFRYAFTGKGSNEQVTDFLNKAGSFADGFESSF